MKIVISSGHGKYISGAVGYIKEHEEAVRVVDEVARYLRAAGVDTVTYEDTVSKTQDENLNRIVSFHNAQPVHDYDVSIHFNANATTSSPVGTECWYLSQKELAAKIATGIAKSSGLKDRGPKYSGGLYFLVHTQAKSVLVEVCFVDSQADTSLYKKTFSAICAAISTAISGQSIVPGPTPPERPAVPEVPAVPADGDHRTIGKGDKGKDVVELQKAIGVLVPDGDFGDITATWVRAFQSACGLTPDGVVGPMTWDEVEDLDNRVTDDDGILPNKLHDQIYMAAQTSEIADYSWPDRGVPPQGYIAGMALSYAYAVLHGGDDVIDVMQRAEGSEDKDALALYRTEFNKLGMSNSTPGPAAMRHLWTLMMGLGPRESSGRYFEGRDLSADNVQAETCEAGLFQTSWNIKAAHSSIAPLLPRFWANPNGFQPEFREGLSPTANNLSCFGSGDGARFQWLSRFCPLFTALVTGVGLRTLRAHWGPIGRKEVTIKKEADELLQEVDQLIGQAGA